jgi:hypothetical protein
MQIHFSNQERRPKVVYCFIEKQICFVVLLASRNFLILCQLVLFGIFNLTPIYIAKFGKPAIQKKLI